MMLLEYSIQFKDMAAFRRAIAAAKAAMLMRFNTDVKPDVQKLILRSPDLYDFISFGRKWQELEWDHARKEAKISIDKLLNKEDDTTNE